MRSARPALKVRSASVSSFAVSHTRAVTGDAARLAAEYLRLLGEGAPLDLLRSQHTEALQRAAKVAAAEGAPRVELAHLERVIPQLLLEF